MKIIQNTDINISLKNDEGLAKCFFKKLPVYTDDDVAYNDINTNLESEIDAFAGNGFYQANIKALIDNG
jgi:hypothetical protein